MSNETTQLTKATLTDLRKRAEHQQVLRKKAPNVDIGVSVRIPFKMLEKRVLDRYKSENVDPSTIHTIPIPMKRATEFAERGYIVELDSAGQPYEDQGHIMMTCPQEQFLEGRKNVAERSRRKQEAFEKDVKLAAEKSGSDMEMKTGHIDTSGGGVNAVADED